MTNAEQYQKDFIREFGELLVKYGEPHHESLGIHHMELSEDGEYVHVYWDNDGDTEMNHTSVCVACDSLGAMVYDIMKRIL